MRIVIVGAGVVGFSLAEDLCSQRHLVSIIDTNSERCDAINSRLDALAVHGDGISPFALEAAGIKEADMVIAVTPKDDTNLVVCNFAKQYGVPKRIARVKSVEFTRPDNPIDLQQTGVTQVIEPEKEVVGSILQYIELPGVTETANFQSDNLYMRGYRIAEGMPIANRSLAEISQMSSPAPMLVVAIIRAGKSVAPTGSQTLMAGDEILAILPKESFPTFKNLLGIGASKLKKVIVSGDALTALLLADALKDISERVLLIDQDEEHGRAAAAQLSGVEVMRGDCTSAELLQEMHIETADFFVAAGKDSEDNVMSCLLAKAEGARQVIAVINSDRHERLFRSLGLDRIVNPRRITAQTIMTRVLRVPIRAHLGLEKVNMGALRLVAERNARICGAPLNTLDKILRKSIIIGAVIRDEDVIIPQGETVIQENDEVLVLCQNDMAQYVKRLFKSSKKPALG